MEFCDMRLSSKFLKVTEPYNGKSKFEFWSSIKIEDVLKVSISFRELGYTGISNVPKLTIENLTQKTEFKTHCNKAIKYLSKVGVEEINGGLAVKLLQIKTRTGEKITKETVKVATQYLFRNSVTSSDTLERLKVLNVAYKLALEYGRVPNLEVYSIETISNYSGFSKEEVSSVVPKYSDKSSSDILDGIFKLIGN